ncbi:uncharacterized protein UTRI_04259_B [Ustilago trichophora]|uniref:DUF4385 domain protein n=1 Tax=Ustilago trichophora TaxID=86804 RepID=A0A5C3ECD5_9BASI|nr:uncharacterized protein UTRI_04259_B [Ustilago trichophora]
MVQTRASSSRTAGSSDPIAGPSAPKPNPKPKSKSKPAPKFPYDLPYAQLCLRTHPHLYRTGIGEQGVLMVEPYKSELLPHWRFRNPAVATESSSKLYSIFLEYVEEGDLVGADMARKFIQMGYTRARRYANHKGGKKYLYDDETKVKAKGNARGRREIERLKVQDQDPDKVEAARIFKSLLDDKVWSNQSYIQLREDHIDWATSQPSLTSQSKDVQQALLKHPQSQRIVRKW